MPWQLKRSAAKKKNPDAMATEKISGMLLIFWEVPLDDPYMYM